MAFQRLNIRAKKSFSALYSFDDLETSPSKSMAKHLESTPRSDRTQDTEECDLEDFGAKLERCKGKECPGRDSPSKRKKLLGSLRSLRSLANLHTSPTKTKELTTPRPDSPSKRQDVCMTPLPMSPSLALLHFEQSPSDTPMFDLTIHQRSVSGSSLEVHHSSPMTVPGSARQSTPYSIFPPTNDLPTGTIPGTPGPMQRAFNCDPANRVPWYNASPTSVESYTPSTPILTPLPGTNLSVGDIDPELVPLPPSANPSTLHLGRSNPGYFDVPIEEEPQMDSTDRLNGLACLKLANECCSDQDKQKVRVRTEVPVGRRGTIEERIHRYEDAKLQNAVNHLDLPQDRMRAHQRRQQAEDLEENVHALGIPKHHQILPLRPKQQNGDLQHRFRKDSYISEDWETCRGGQSAGMASTHSLDHTRPLSVSPNAPSKKGKEAGNGNDTPPRFDYVVWDSPHGLLRGPAPENLWGRHIGLYDGTGYGPDSSGPSTPREPDEGIPDVCSKASSAPLSVDGECSGHTVSNRHLKGEDLCHGPVRESPFTGHEQCNDDALETIYRSYAGRVPSNSSEVADEDAQLPATKADEIRS